jgi:hypothetical protein
MKDKNSLSQDRFARLETSLQQALQHARGQRHDLRVTIVATPPTPKKNNA